MRPGGWFPRPMLLADESLDERLASDAERLRATGVDASELGGRLLRLLERAVGSDWGSPVSEGDLEVEILRRRGILTCPWAPEEFESCGYGDGGKRAGANQFRARNVARGVGVEGFVLSAHLIAEHGFFGGTDTDFRIEPEELSALLGPSPT